MSPDLIAATIQTTAGFERLLAAIEEVARQKLVAARLRKLKLLMNK